MLTISEDNIPYARQKAEELRHYGIRVSVDERQEKIGYKLREARTERIPYILVIGQKEVESDSYAVRRRGEGEIGQMKAEEFLLMVTREDEEKVIF